MDQRSEKNLFQVHQDLAKVMRATSQSPQPFVVINGIRTLEAERQAVATGHSTTMHSRHLPQVRYKDVDAPDGRACAVDVAPLIGGKLVLDPPHEDKVYGQIFQQVLTAAQALRIRVEWGGDWRSFKDWGHIQLPWHLYP